VHPQLLESFSDELTKIAAYKRVMKAKRIFGKIKRMHKKRRVPRMHKKWKWKRPGAGGGGGGGGGSQ
jgi:hypothetical protein